MTRKDVPAAISRRNRKQYFNGARAILTRASRAAAALALVAVALRVAAPARRSGSGLVTFVGSLVAVTKYSIMLRGPDGVIFFAALPAQGPLSAQTLSAYPFGERVRAECNPLVGLVYVTQGGRRLTLELTNIHDLGMAPPDELRAAGASPDRLVAGNLLPHPPAKTAVDTSAAPNSVPMESPTAAAIEKMRGEVLAYLDQMPNYIANEKIQRLASSQLGSQRYDRIDDTVSIVDGIPTRTNIRLNGHAWPAPFSTLPGDLSLTRFWETPRGVLHPDCPAQIEPGKPVKEAGMPALAFAFTTPTDGCGGDYMDAYFEYFPGTTGQIITRSADGALLKMEMHTTGFPPEFSITSSELSVTWGDVEDGGATYHVPTAAATKVKAIDMSLSQATYVYDKYRHFSVSHRLIIRP